ncbi:hypothetical protein ABW20_dc0103069 [Dactylellina cionopaga]|nr:hypothetical protein ABW20_dc0103069 [Dactylellina cionopaga]
MPYISSTPEVLAARLIGRADSRNPATTCRGISISTGKPCRRNITAKAPKGRGSTSSGGGGSDTNGGESNNDRGQANPAEEFFCWQHKDQAADTVVVHRSDSQKKRRLQGRSSLDTLVEVILGPDANDEGNGDGGAGRVGPGQTEVIIRRETLLGDDEVMVVRKNTVVKKDAKIVKEAKKREEGKKAVWDALHGQQQPGQGQNQVHPPQRPQSYNQQHMEAQPSQIRPQRIQPPRLNVGNGMGQIQEAPGDTYPPNNEFKPQQQQRPRPTSYRPKKKPSLLAQLFCCIADDDDRTPPSRPQGHNQQAQPQMQAVRPRPPQQPPQQQNTAPYPNFKPYNQQPPPQHTQQILSVPQTVGGPHIKFDNNNNNTNPARPLYPPNLHEHNGWDAPSAEPEISSDSDSDSDDESVVLPVDAVQSITPTLPSHLSAKTRTRITAEMKKPISQKDMPGYIYIFWLKDDTGAPAPAPAASTTEPPILLAPPPPSNKPRKYSYVKDPGSAALFRAVDDDFDDEEEDENTPQQQQQQPQPPGKEARNSPSSVPGSNGGKGMPAQKVPFSHRVERLIHLELRDDYYNKPHVCETCQRVHKEWFAVPGTREGVKRVDEVIKRWCRWAEGVEGAVNKREQGGVIKGLGHRRGDSGGSSIGFPSPVERNEESGRRTEKEMEKEGGKVTGGVRGVEKPIWRDGYGGIPEEIVDYVDESQKKRMERKGTFGFL